MSNDAFKVSPVKHYDGARYPSTYARKVDDAPPIPALIDEEERLTLGALLRYAATLTLVLGLSFGLVACFVPQWANDIPGVVTDDAGDGGSDGGHDGDGGDITMGVQAECTPGDVMCEDDYTLATCSEGYSYDRVDCNDWCMETYGEWGMAWSMGCDVTAEEPCQCQYDMIAGVMAECTPGDVMCSGDDVMICTDDYWYDYIDCDASCQDQLGSPTAYSTGCDASASDPCQCADDAVELCADASLGEALCVDASTLLVCTSGVPPTPRDCDEVCRDQHGSHAYSLGCDVAADDPCQCEYDMIDGGAPACMPGDVECTDTYTLTTCGDDGIPTSIDCNEQCATSTPDGWGYSMGCNVDAEDPCQCEYDIVGGVAPACMPGDVMCADDQTLAVCNDGYWYENIDCDAHCQQTLQDPYAYSLGCDMGAEDPCQCQYDIIDGDVAACTPGDIYCSDASTAQVCNQDHWSYTAYDCTTYCSDTYGPGFVSIGCDTLDPNNFCGCKEEPEEP